MPSKKPKIQGVVDQELHQAFIEWKNNRGISSDGEALATIIRVYILGELPEITGNHPQALKEKLDSLSAVVDRLSVAVTEIGDNQVMTRDNQHALRQEVEAIKKF